MTNICQRTRPSVYASFLFALSLISIASCSSSRVEAQAVRLIRRDALEEPYVRIANALRRSMARATGPQTPVLSIHGDYFIAISIGNPGQDLLALIDTASDLSWTQCKLQDNEFDPREPVFDPNDSKTYSFIPCTSPECSHDVGGSCPSLPNNRSPCQYSVSYKDGSSATGILSRDSLRVGSVIDYHNFAFGCANEAHYDEKGAVIAAAVGLGSGRYSLISQTKRFSQNMFSYCLESAYDPRPNSSIMQFGPESAISGQGMVSVPLVRKSKDSTFDYLRLVAISVGNKRIDASSSFSRGGSRGRRSSGINNNSDGTLTILDSSTTLTLLPSELYGRVDSAVMERINLPAANDPNGIVSRCYTTTRNDYGPKMTMHFAGGVGDVKLGYENCYVRVADNVSCLAFAPTIGEDAVYGNLAQVHFWVAVNRNRRTVSFKRNPRCPSKD